MYYLSTVLTKEECASLGNKIISVALHLPGCAWREITIEARYLVAYSESGYVKWENWNELT